MRHFRRPIESAGINNRPAIHPLAPRPGSCRLQSCNKDEEDRGRSGGVAVGEIRTVISTCRSEATKAPRSVPS